MTNKAKAGKGKVKDEINRLNGLLAVWDNLTANSVGLDGKEYTSCYLQFDVAMEIFFSFYENVGYPFLNTDKDKFMYALLHEKWGLCIYLVTLEGANEKWIVLKSDEVDMELFLDAICKAIETHFEPRITLDRYIVKSILETLDTEWDKVVARVLLGINRSKKQLDSLGIEGDDISKNVERVTMVLEEVARSNIAAEDLTNLHLKEKKDRLENQIIQKQQIITMKKDIWPANAVNDAEACINDLQERVDDINNLILDENSRYRKCLQQMRSIKPNNLLKKIV